MFERLVKGGSTCCIVFRKGGASKRSKRPFSSSCVIFNPKVHRHLCNAGPLIVLVSPSQLRHFVGWNRIVLQNRKTWNKYFQAPYCACVYISLSSHIYEVIWWILRCRNCSPGPNFNHRQKFLCLFQQGNLLALSSFLPNQLLDCYFLL